MTRDSERMTTARTTHTASAIGIVSASAAVPASARTRIASSVAYADEEMLSEAMIASPVFLERRSLPSCSDLRRAPMNTRPADWYQRPHQPGAASALVVAT